MVTLNVPLVSLPRHPNRPNPTVNNYQNFSDRLLSLVDSCTREDHVKQIHAQMLRTGVFFDPFSSSKLFTAVALPPLSSLDYARKMFDEMPQPNRYSWNTLIRAYATSSEPSRGLVVFLEMLHRCPEFPNRLTFPFVIKAASEVNASRTGRAVHGMVIKASLDSNVYILNSLVHFYSSCGDLNLAYRVFARASEKDVVSWNSIIAGFAQGGCPEQALELFREMEAEGVKPNVRTMSGLLIACTKMLDLESGKWVCSYIARNDIGVDLSLRNAMLDMYMKCGSFDDAESLFETMYEKDVVSWTTMIDGYAKLGKYDEARRVLDSMPHQKIAAWNALISAYEQNGKPKEALAIFHELQLNNNAKPNEVTLVSALSACSHLGAIELGRRIHVYIKKHNVNFNCHLTTSLIDMYSKCGDLEKALEVFNSVERKDVFVWSSMIAGLGMHGRGNDAIDLFYEMQDTKVKPNSVTFTNLLCACSHSGLVEEGKMIFNEMELVYRVVPSAMHYTCMVDILGRAGLLEEAMRFINQMPTAPTASVYGALLGGCRLHGDLELAEVACSRLLELDPRNHGAMVLLSNIYAKTEKWDSVSGLRKLMRDSGIKKEPGCSSIEVDGVFHEFLVGDNSHPCSEDIYAKLDEISGKLKSVGYVSNKSQVLQLVEEEDVKEQSLMHHSEKLAIAYGLISTSQSQPIRVVKNLRVCHDCHSVAKLISSLYDREILLRDRYRFHHFRNGNCSCMDYW